MQDILIREVRAGDRPAVAAFLRARWGSEMVVSRGTLHNASGLPGFIAFPELGDILGLATYHIDGTACELVTLDSLVKVVGIGTALLDAVRSVAAGAGCTRLWLITTNDNWPAFRFYQRRNFQLVALHRAAIETSRRLKPEIPAIGFDRIPIRDEIEMELPL